MRDERHLDRFYYLGDRNFYEPMYLAYNPNLDFYKIVKRNLKKLNVVNMNITREQWWWFVYNEKLTLPLQGWKIHVSANLDNSEKILNCVSEYLIKKKISFKFLLDEEVLILFNLKNFPRGNSGKFITIYPNNDNEFKIIIEDLYKILKNEVGPYILSDKRYKDSKVLYYRYGGFQKISTLDIIGRHNPVILTPKGEKVTDERKPFFQPPSWVNDPFEDSRASARKKNSVIVLNNRYLIKNAILFSNSGGVYVAYDRKTRKKVVLKESRPNTNFDRYGNDSVKLLRKEFEILDEIKEFHIAPHPIDFFKQWEHYFLVESFESGY